MFFATSQTLIHVARYMAIDKHQTSPVGLGVKNEFLDFFVITLIKELIKRSNYSIRCL